MLIWNLIRLVSRRGSRNIALLGSLIWLSASVAILKLDLTLLIARFLGIGRGADLVLYFLVITFLIWMFHIYQRFQRLEEQITENVWHIALQNVVHPQASEDTNRQNKLEIQP
jgi:hypothetical protein